MADGVCPILVTGTEEADGPIGAEHDFIGAKDFEGFLEVGGDGFGIAFACGEFGEQAGEFYADEVVALGEFFHAGAPGGFDATVAGFRFGDVVEDDGEVWLAVDELDGDGELALEDEQIVGQVVGGELGEAAVEIIAEEVFVRLFLEDVADGFEFRKRGEAFEIGADVFIDKGNPADDGLDAVGLVGEGEEEIGLGDDLAGLDGDGSGDACGGGDGFEFGDELVLGKRGARGNPSIILF